MRNHCASLAGHCAGIAHVRAGGYAVRMETETAQRFTVRRTLPNLWEVHDSHRRLTEFVLFGDYGVDHRRMFATDEALRDGQRGLRGDVLRDMAHKATRSGMQHSFVPPPRPAPVGFCH